MYLNGQMFAQSPVWVLLKSLGSADNGIVKLSLDGACKVAVPEGDFIFTKLPRTFHNSTRTNDFLDLRHGFFFRLSAHRRIVSCGDIICNAEFLHFSLLLSNNSNSR